MNVVLQRGWKCRWAPCQHSQRCHPPSWGAFHKGFAVVPWKILLSAAKSPTVSNKPLRMELQPGLEGALGKHGTGWPSLFLYPRDTTRPSCRVAIFNSPHRQFHLSLAAPTPVCTSVSLLWRWAKEWERGHTLLRRCSE